MNIIMKPFLRCIVASLIEENVMENQQTYFRSGHSYLDRDEDKYVRNIIEKFLEISCLKKTKRFWS